MQQYRELCAVFEDMDFSCSMSELADFFNGLLINYFCDTPRNYPWSDLWEVFEGRLDELEYTNRGQIIQNVIEEVASRTKLHLPMYSELDRWAKVVNAKPIGNGVILVELIVDSNETHLPHQLGRRWT